MFFLPHSYCFLSLDAKNPTKPKQQNPPRIPPTKSDQWIFVSFHAKQNGDFLATCYEMSISNSFFLK